MNTQSVAVDIVKDYWDELDIFREWRVSTKMIQIVAGRSRHHDSDYWREQILIMKIDESKDGIISKTNLQMTLFEISARSVCDW